MSFKADDVAGRVNGILTWIEERVDMDHLRAVEARYEAAYRWAPLDRPPVVISSNVPDPFIGYPYGQGFEDPLKMMVNELVGPATVLYDGGSPSIVNSVVIRDDFPLQIRPNYGIGLIPSLFGATSVVAEDRMPWVKPLGRQRVEQLVAAGVPELAGGLYGRAIETMELYRETLAPYPKCRQAIRITQPDLQGPFDTLAQLWGGEVFYAFHDDPAFLRQALDVMVETYIAVCRSLTRYTTQVAVGDLIYLHFSMQRGACVLKDDSAVMLSPKMYQEFLQPANGKLLQALGGGSIHWCGCGDHWMREFVETPGLLGVDLGQPEMVDLAAWQPVLKEGGIAVTNAPFDLDAFTRLDPLSRFPTGACLKVSTDTPEQGRELLGRLDEQMLR